MSDIPITFERDLSARAYADEVGAEELFRRDHVKNAQKWQDYFAGQTVIGAGQTISPSPNGSDNGGGGGQSATARIVVWSIPSGPIVEGRELRFSQNGGAPTVYTVLGTENTMGNVASALCALYNAVPNKLWTLTYSFNVNDGSTTITATAVATGTTPNAYSPTLTWGNNDASASTPAVRLFTLYAPSQPFGAGARLSVSVNALEIGYIDTDDITITTLDALANAVVAALANNSTPFDFTMTSENDIVRIVATAKVPGTAANNHVVSIVFQNSPMGFSVAAESAPPSEAGTDGEAANSVSLTSNTDGEAAQGGGGGGSTPTLLVCSMWAEVTGSIDFLLNGADSIRCRPPTGKKALIVLENFIIDTSEDDAFKFHNPGTRDARVNFFVAYNIL